MYWQSLNGLRGFLCLAVFAGHFVASYKFEGSLAFINSFFSLGVQAPWVFFVVSGFLLMNSYQQTGRNLPVAKYYGRRAFRIFPLLWVIVLIDTSLKGYAFDLNFLKNLLLLNGILPYREIELVPVVAWTLAVEEMYYLAMPFIGRTSTLIKSLLILLALQLALHPFQDWIMPILVSEGEKWPNPVGSFVKLFAGIVIYHFYMHRRTGVFFNSRLFPWALDLALVSSFLLWLAGFSAQGTYLSLLFLCSALTEKSFFSRLFWSAGIFKFAGVRCFSIYLTHMLSLRLLEKAGWAQGLRELLLSWPLAGFQNFIWMLAVFAIVLLVAELAYQLIEKPLTACGKKLLT